MRTPEKCLICQKIHPDQCKGCRGLEEAGQEQSRINCLGLCRSCQRLKDAPRPYRVVSGHAIFYGCYFPSSDLNAGERGQMGTGEPKGVEWL